MAKSYSDKLRDPRWQKKRLQILERDEFACSVCKDTETELQVHHHAYNGNPWEVEDYLLTTVCKHCHPIMEVCRRGDDIGNVLRCFKLKIKDSYYVVGIILSLDTPMDRFVFLKYTGNAHEFTHIVPHAVLNQAVSYLNELNELVKNGD